MERMIAVSWFYSIGSLSLGFTAWILACIAIKCKKGPSAYRFSAGSFAACITSLLLQFLEIKNRTDASDLGAVEDTIWGVILASLVLIGITFLLNSIAVSKAGKSRI